MEKTILLVEDDVFLIDIYSSKIKEAGFEVEVAEDGEAAIKKAKETKPDIVLLDLVLPKADGWEFLKEIKAIPELKDTKIIILSNLGQKDEIEKGLQMGADKYLVKAHYTPSEVIEEVKKILK